MSAAVMQGRPLVVMDGLLRLSAPPVVVAPPSSRARASPTSAVQLVGGRAFPPLRPGSAAVQVGGTFYLPPPHPLEPYLPGAQMPRLGASMSAPRMPLRKKKGGPGAKNPLNPQHDLEKSLERMGDALVRETAYEQERLQAEKQRLHEAEEALKAAFEAQIAALKLEHADQLKYEQEEREKEVQRVRDECERGVKKAKLGHEQMAKMAGMTQEQKLANLKAQMEEQRVQFEAQLTALQQQIEAAKQRGGPSNPPNPTLPSMPSLLSRDTNPS